MLTLSSIHLVRSGSFYLVKKANKNSNVDVDLIIRNWSWRVWSRVVLEQSTNSSCDSVRAREGWVTSSKLSIGTAYSLKYSFSDKILAHL